MSRLSRTVASLALVALLPAAVGAQAYQAPAGGVSRAEFVRMTLDRVGGFTFNGTHCFTDVTTQTYAPQVCAAKIRGIVTGHPDGSFRPDQPVQFVEAAAIAVRAKGAAVGAGTPWYVPYLQQMASWNAIPSSVRSLFDTLTPDQANAIISQVVAGSSEGGTGGSDDPDDDEDSVTVSNREMRLTVSGPDRAERGDRVTFAITIENRDDRDIRPDIRATLDDDLSFVSASDKGDDDDDLVEWGSLRIREGESLTLSLTVRVRSGAKMNSTLRLRVEADDLRVTKGLTVGDPLDEDDLRISIIDSDDPVDRLGTVTYRIRLQNRSDDEMTLDVRALLDRGMDFVSATDGGTVVDDEEVEWEDIEIEDGESKTILLTVRLNSRARSGDSLQMRVEAGGLSDTETTRVRRDGSDTDGGDEDVTVSITDSPDPASIGDIVRYRITVRNREDRDISLDIRAELDDGMTFYSATRSGRRSGDYVYWDDIDIDEDDTEVLLLDVRINSNARRGQTVTLRVEAGDGSDTETTAIRN